MASMGERLQRERKKRDLTQVTLAQTTGVGLATIRRIEQHAFEPRLDTVRRLAAALQVRAGWLAFGEEPRADMNDGVRG
jgi:transcriptional regulator with XRE-family HTH domain